MYNQFFGFSDAPFSIAPNPQFLYMSPRHQEALAHLLYGVQSEGGFILLTGEVGTGKTTLCRCLLAQIPEDVETAYVLNPRVTAKQLLATICDEFGIDYPPTASLTRLIDNLNTYLLDCHASHRRAVLIIDEAQNLSAELLEQLRLLTNLETNERKLLQIILLGQPELLDMLAEKKLRQFSQRITARFHLQALNRQETLDYIRHRLQVVGSNDGIFTASAMTRVHRLSGGIPRVINLICDRALLGAYSQDQHQVTARIVQRAALEVLGKSRRKRVATYTVAASVAVIVGIVATAIYITQLPQAEPIAEMPESRPATASIQVIGHRQIEQAYHDLFALWGTAFEDRTEDPCVLAEAVNLRCYELSADLDRIAQINRPVIVNIDDQFLTVSHLDDKHVTLIAGTHEATLTKAQFRSMQNGAVSMLWRTPPAYSGALKVSDSGETVDWLVMQLSRIEGETPPTSSGYIYNESLAARVRNFQASVGLPPSGVADPLTLLHLNSVEDDSIPTLNGNRG